MIDTQTIMNYLPHRYPFLLVDRVLDFVPDTSLKAMKCVSINEPFFQGHFPDYPVMPGVLIVESLAQACGLYAAQTMVESDIPPSDDHLFFLAGIDGVRFRKQVVPGDQLILNVEVDRHRQGIWKFKCRAEVDAQLVCAADIMAAFKQGN